MSVEGATTALSDVVMAAAGAAGVVPDPPSENDDDDRDDRDDRGDRRRRRSDWDVDVAGARNRGGASRRLDRITSRLIAACAAVAASTVANGGGMDHAAACALGTLSVAAAATDALLDSEAAVYALTTTLIWSGSATDAAARARAIVEREEEDKKEKEKGKGGGGGGGGGGRGRAGTHASSVQLPEHGGVGQKLFRRAGCRGVLPRVVPGGRGDGRGRRAVCHAVHDPVRTKKMDLRRGGVRPAHGREKTSRRRDISAK
jgi:hypothetical protein